METRKYKNNSNEIVQVRVDVSTKYNLLYRWHFVKPGEVVELPKGNYKGLVPVEKESNKTNSNNSTGNDDKYKELKKLNLDQLKEVAVQNDLEFEENVTKKQLVEMIIALDEEES